MYFVSIFDVIYWLSKLVFAFALLYIHFLQHNGNIQSSILRRPLGDLNLRYKSMERTLRRHKNKVHPRKPEILSDVVKAYDDQTIMFNYGLNLRKTDRFYINTVYGESFEFTLFASFQIIRLIEDHIAPENRHYSMDGTFDMTPLKCFHQLLIIHIEYGKSVSLHLINCK